MATYGNLEVDAETLKDIASGLQEDLSYMRVNLSNMRVYVESLKDSWQNYNYEAFSKTYFEAVDSLMSDLNSMQKVMTAMRTSVKAYGELEQLLNEDARKLK